MVNLPVQNIQIILVTVDRPQFVVTMSKKLVQISSLGGDYCDG